MTGSPLRRLVALAHDSIHAVEHLCLFAFGLLLWAPIVEPLPAPAWFTTRLKVVYMTGVWFVGLIFANVLWFSGAVLYSRYLETARLSASAPFGIRATPAR